MRLTPRWVVAAATAAMTVAFVPTVVMWLDGFRVDDLAQLVAQVVVSVSAALLALSAEHRRASLLLALGAVAMGASNLTARPFEAWGYALMVGWAVQWLAVGFVLPVLLTFPGQRLDRLGRVLVWFTWTGVILWRVVTVPTWDPAWGGYTGPARWLTYPGIDSPALSDRLGVVDDIALAVLGLGCLVAFARRWRGAHGLARTPVRVIAVAGIGLSVAVPLQDLADAGLVPDSLWRLAYDVQSGLLILMPLGILFVATRSALRRGVVVERLGACAGDARGVRDVLAAELQDPSLALFFRLPSGWLDVAGSIVSRNDPPYAAGPGRHWETLRGGRAVAGAEPSRESLPADRREDEAVAAIDLADDCRTDPGRLRVALNAAALVLDNTRLAVEREAHLDQLKGAQARIVEAGLAERRRLERDLHDGAQQQLLAVSTTLSRARLLSEPEAVRATVDVAREQLATALADLRRLARGIHPGVLTQGGLVAGLEPLARADPRVELVLDERLESGLRLAPDVESAAYFVAAECLSNAIKHADATRITVSGRLEGVPPELLLIVTDDGRGGAILRRGGGLAGLADRVAALGGAFDVASKVGEGTRVTVRMPRALDRR